MFLPLILLFTLYSVAFGAEPTSGFVGTWHGSSTCLIKDSPCHDETVIYEITPQGTSSHFNMAGYKLVAGQRAFMGDLPCDAAADGATATCLYPANCVWKWTLHGDSMQGELTCHGDRFRTIQVQRDPKLR